MSSSILEEIFDKRFMSGIKQLDVHHHEEVLLYPPSEYMDLTSPIPSIQEALRLGKLGESVFIQLKLKGAPELFDDKGKPLSLSSAKSSKGTHRVKVRFTDGRDSGMFMAFGRAGGGNLDGWCKLKPNDIFYCYGRFNDDWNGVVSINTPELIPQKDAKKIVARYTGKDRVISPFRISSKIQEALLDGVSESVEYMQKLLGMNESEIIKKTKIPFATLSDFINKMHRPATTDDVNAVKLGIDRLNALMVFKKSLEHKAIDNNPLSNFSINIEKDIPPLVSRLPFKLTGDQKYAIWDILKDLNTDKPMRRLLSGDVGTGKTVCYMVPAVAAQKSGKNVVIMSPNSLLTGQIANEIRQTYPEVPVVELQGGMKEYPSVPDNCIVVGTTAILFWLESINFNYKVDLYILDEQQKLGREQKERMLQEHTNFLEATATAIPRTIALIKYTDMSVSRIKECPVKKTIRSHIIGSDGRGQAMGSIKEALASGGQVAVLYPRRTRELSKYVIQVNTANSDDFELIISKLIAFEDEKFNFDFDDKTNQLIIETTTPIMKRVKGAINNIEGVSFNVISEEAPTDDEDACRVSVEEAAKKWESMYPGRVAMLHGQTPKNEKFEILEKMKRKEVDIVITSSVIEIGLTLPSLTFVMVVGADKMGASTLHQIRGRLVRHGGEGDFYMFVDKPKQFIPEKSMDRLLNVMNNLNGFDIAENDMVLRGAGDIGKMGNKQSGLTKGLFPGSKTSTQEIDRFIMEVDG